MRRDKQLLDWSDRGAVIYPRPAGAATPAAAAVYMAAAAALSWRVRVSHTDERRLRYRQLLRQIAGLAVRNPGLVPLLIGAAWRFRATDWYRRAPFLPLPPADYVEWRLHTAYGDGDATPDPTELARYLRWSARMRKQQRP